MNYMIVRNLKVLLILFLPLSCSTSKDLSKSPLTEIPDYHVNYALPEKSKATSAEKGSTIAFSVTGNFHDALAIREDLVIKVDEFSKPIDSGAVFIKNRRIGNYVLFQFEKDKNYGLATRGKGAFRSYFIHNEEIKFGKYVDLKASEDTYPVISKHYSQRALIYDGKNGDILYLIFTEYNDPGKYRQEDPDFVEELQHDITESNYFSLRGLKVEILKANNSEIVYKLNEPFNDKP